MNSAIYIFFIIVFAVYYLPILKKTPKAQNLWLLMANYVFYALADWRMLALLVGATLLFYLLGNAIAKDMESGKEKRASRLTTLGVMVGVGVLLYFKYFDFFAQTIAQLLSTIGLNVSWTALNIIVPVGVSFFTFKLIAYIIEIHREKIDPADGFVSFASYISFFPTILSGPIDTPNKFLPQLKKARHLDYDLATDGCRQILWGMLLKMVVADKLAFVTDEAWTFMSYQSASTLLFLALLFPIQIYVDFASYSDMAIGVGKLMGFRVERNFNHPLLARNVAEYWRRWHMSLTNWITSYIFMPLNIRFRNFGKWGVALAVIINLVVIGLWHGANWTFALFGLYHGLLFIPIIFMGAFGKNKKIKPYELTVCTHKFSLPKMTDLMKMLATFLLVAIGHVIFRAPDVNTAFQFLTSICAESLFTIPNIPIGSVTSALIIIVIILEWICRNDEHPLQTLRRTLHHRWLRIIIYYIILIIIFRYQTQNHEFIYFQF